MGHYYRPAEGGDLPGIGLLDLATQHPGKRRPRLIGNIVIRWDPPQAGAPPTLVGFENHGWRTVLGSAAHPLGQVVAGFGNNGVDRTEGAVYRNAYGTYLHGPLLPKNPWFADHLIMLALRRRHGEVELALLADLVPPQQRVTAFALYRLAINAGFAFGPAAAGFLADRSFFWLFLGDALTSAVFGVVALVALP